jgi:hypothetical protein
VDALRLAIILTIVVACVVIATRPQPSRRRSPRPVERRRRPNASNGATKHRLGLGRGLAVQRNHWDRTDLDRAIGRDYDDADGSLSAWPSA